jgi:hypothetical protein
MHFDIKEYDLNGDFSASKLFLVKYFDQYAPENSAHSLTIAKDEAHLKEIEKAKLQVLFDREEWFSADSESAEPGEFEEQFENDWGNWIKYFEIGSAI